MKDIKHQNQEDFWKRLEHENDPEKKRLLSGQNAKALGLDKLKEKGYKPKLK